MKNNRHPKNANGDFYVENGSCIMCLNPCAVAPNLIGFDERTQHCFFKKQPELDEIEQAIKAMKVSCCGAYRYAGDDKGIIKKLERNHIEF